MQKTRKAVLLSALVLPGLGQIILKRYKTGMVIMLGVAAGLYKMISIAVAQANAIVNRIIEQGGTPDITAIANAAGQASVASGNASFNLFLWLVIICWLASIVDAYLAGKGAAP